MKLKSTLAHIFHMTEATWARHANPWSVWTRYLCLPFFVLAIWSWDWIGAYALIPIGLTVLWTWCNPRAFPPPKTTNHWASKAVLGERIWLSHPKPSLPRHHTRAIMVLNILTMAGFIICLYGLYARHVWCSVFGLAITMLGKSWFLDRMVWLHQDLRATKEKYKNWER